MKLRYYKSISLLSMKLNQNQSYFNTQSTRYGSHSNNTIKIIDINII